MKRSIWLGYLIAPFMGPLAYGMVILFMPIVTERKEFSAESWLISVTLMILASYAACLVLGAPLIVLLKKYNKLTLIWVSSIGSLLYAAAVCVVLFMVMSPTITGELSVIVIKTLLSGLGVGLLVTVVFSYAAGITKHSNRPTSAAHVL